MAGRLREQVAARDESVLGLEREAVGLRSQLKALQARELACRRRCEAQQEKIEKLRLELQAAPSPSPSLN